MRRWLAVLLLVLMPVQFAWAAAARHCLHEADAAGGHWGHHEAASHGQAAEPAAQPEPGAEPSEPGNAAVDCHHCHGPAAGLLVALAAAAALLPDEPPAPPTAAARAEPVPAQPERPQWAPLA